MPLRAEIRAQHKLGRLSALRYRLPMQVAEVMVLIHGESYPVCPRCGCTMDREYMNFCDRCGQRLDWERFDFAETVHAFTTGAVEAGTPQKSCTNAAK